MVELRDIVRYTDKGGRTRRAFVVRIHESMSNILNFGPSVNLVTLTDRDDVLDPYGLQKEHYENVPHRSGTSAPGNYWEEQK